MAFGDAHQKILGQMDGESIGLKPQRSEVVTTDFETNDDLQPSRTDRSTTSLPSSSKKGENLMKHKSKMLPLSYIVIHENNNSVLLCSLIKENRTIIVF